MSFDPNQSYNDIPLLPPNGELESTQILKACIPARTSLAELKQAGDLLPNQGLLINILPILEARDSSMLLEIQQGKEKLFLHPKLMHLLTADNATVTAYKAHRLPIP